MCLLSMCSGDSRPAGPLEKLQFVYGFIRSNLIFTLVDHHHHTQFLHNYNFIQKYKIRMRGIHELGMNVKTDGH